MIESLARRVSNAAEKTALQQTSQVGFFIRQFTSRSIGGRLISKAVFENASISGLGFGVS